MGQTIRVAMLSDVHYAGPAELARGDDYEHRAIKGTFRRSFARFFRHHFWLRHPLRHNGLLDRFLEAAAQADYCIGGGDYTLDANFVGVSDDGACEGASECLGKIRAHFGDRFHGIIGDHELGKLNMFGVPAGLRLASWQRATTELGLNSCWRFDIGNHALIGVTSTLLALPLFRKDMKPGEEEGWDALRAQHFNEVRTVFAAIEPQKRVLLFCHDPTALPFLWREEAVRAKLNQIEQTLIGHLHSNLILWKSRRLSGMPPIGFMGHSVLRMSTALSEARHWKPFHVRLCPSLAGIELLKDGGWIEMELDPDAVKPVRFLNHRLKR